MHPVRGISHSMLDHPENADAVLEAINRMRDDLDNEPFVLIIAPVDPVTRGAHHCPECPL